MKPSEFTAKPRLTLLTSSVLATFALLSACGGGSSGSEPESALAAAQPSMQIAAADAAASSAELGASAPAAASGIQEAIALSSAAATSPTASAASTLSPTAKIAAVALPTKAVAVATLTPIASTTTAVTTKAASVATTTLVSVGTSGIPTTSIPSTQVSSIIQPGSSTLAVAIPAAPVLIKALAPIVLAADAKTPTSMLGLSALMTGLSYVSTNPTATTSGVGVVAQCNRGYTPPASLTKSAPVALPNSGGVFYTPAELATWKQRIVTGPFVKANDYTTGSPGDWTRIVANAKALATNGEVMLSASTPESNFGSHGTLARDAAFYQLVTADGTMLAPVRKFLLAQAANAAVDFGSTLCITDKAGNTVDSKYFQASWLLRYVVTYDYVRGSLSSADRLTIENFIRRNSYFMAGHIDWGLVNILPMRQLGDYSKRSDAAAAKTDSTIWWTKSYDTNGDCKVNSSDKGASLPVYTYVTVGGTVGPRISVLSQYYNNRKSIASTAFGAAGILLGDTELITSAKRYFMEWLAYGVWPDGSQGEYARNGDYCIAQQGPIYAASNTQGAVILARLLARQGDKSMVNFSTTDGLFGTQSISTSSPKSIELVAQTQLNLLTGQLKWFFYEPWRDSQNLTNTGSLGNTEVRYMNSINAMDDYHELGLLPAATLFSKLPIANVVMRNKTVTTLRFPGATGNPVPTGYGNWNDAFNALPAVLLLRP